MFAIVGAVEREGVGDGKDYAEHGWNRPTWWLEGPKAWRLKDEVSWMVQCMHVNAASGVMALDKYDVTLNDSGPSFDEMIDAANVYHRHTGHFAFPVYVEEMYSSGSPYPQQPLIDIYREGDAGPATADIPAGFLILSRDEADDRFGEGKATWDDAYDVMSDAAEIHNDNAQGRYIESVVGIFSSDADEEPEYMHSMCMRHSELEERTRVMLETVTDRLLTSA